jgi:hypothetical protein
MQTVSDLLPDRKDVLATDPAVAGERRSRESELGRRLHSRIRMIRPVRLLSEFGDQDVQLRNLSPGGVQLWWSHAVSPGCRVIIVLSHHELGGRVTWSSKHLGGVIFDAFVSPELMLALTVLGEAPRAPEPVEDPLLSLKVWKENGGRF